MAIVVKRRGKNETYDDRKIYGSIYAACKDCDLGEKESEKIAEKTCSEVKKFLQGKKEVNSTEIFGFVLQKLAKEHEAVAFMYQTHRDIV
ncbi:MAG: ATP cone domain-containing protein [Candidatus Micrarchaeota archaeon]|nr:hypothetical protein [Candidatus Micrarchaeota archaeon]MBU1681826.1 hypothetical protein [Candidatus Micrarchaeota archaeon]